MGRKTAEAPLTESVWEMLEARLSEGIVPPLRVLLATDGSDAAMAAEGFLAHLPLPVGSAVRVVTVLDAPEWQVPESLKGAEQEWGRRIGRAAEARVARPGLQLTHRTPRGAPAREILQAADEFNADLAVVGSHGRTGLHRFLLGSVAENVAKHAARPVLVARAPSHGLRRVVLAVDGSEHAARAIRLAGHFPLPVETEVTACHVVRPYHPMAGYPVAGYPVTGPEYLPDFDQIIAEARKQQQEDAERLVVTAAKRLRQWGKSASTAVREGDPAAEIIQLASDQDADLVIAGARGLSAIHTLIVGSVADRLLKNARCSVLLVH